MIIEDYCSYEVAKLLKEKGFDCKTEHSVWYVIKQFSTGCHWNACTYKVGDITREYNDDCCIPMPTHQMAIAWLREVYGLYIWVDYSRLDCNEKQPYLWNIVETKIDGNYWGGTYNKSSKNAVESALNYCLKNLI